MTSLVNDDSTTNIQQNQSHPDDLQDLQQPILQISSTATCGGKCKFHLKKLQITLSRPLYLKLIYSIIWVLFTYYLIGVTNAIVDNRALSAYHSDDHLVDIGFDLISNIFGNKLRGNIYPDSNDVCCDLSIGSLFVFIIIFFPSNKQRIALLTQWAVLWNVMFTIRSLNVCVTPLPAPKYQQSNHKCYHWDNIFMAPFLILAGTHHSCHDFFFSGHTVNAMISALMITYYGRYSPILIKHQMKYLRYFGYFYIWFLFILMIFFMLILQDHYTMDITTAIALTVMMFFLYQYQISMRIGFFWWWTEIVIEY